MSKVKIACDGVMQLSEVIANLERMVADMRAGTLVLSVGEECLALQPAILVNMAMKASQKKDKEKFVLELSWRKIEGLEGVDNPATVRVTSWNPESVAG